MVVLLDVSAGAAGELSVRCGQTVELVERSSERPGWCLARTTDPSPPQVTAGAHGARTAAATLLLLVVTCHDVCNR